jgi:glutathione-regulated potassium-efflux system ancillary protein KefG
MARILILFAHPRLQNSRIHRSLSEGLEKIPHLTFHDLYESYPDFDIDVEHEHDLLLNHDVFVMQFPFYWYSSPPLLKQWIDLVLEHGWAYGQKGKALEGKKLMQAISTGGREESYRKGSFNMFTIREFITPFEQTARLCNMDFLPPFVIHGTHLATEEDIKRGASAYQMLLKNIAEDKIDFEAFRNMNYANEILPKLSNQK